MQDEFLSVKWKAKGLDQNCPCDAVSPAKDGFPPSTTAMVALIHHHTGDLVSSQETPPSRVNQPFINFCNKYPTSLLTLEITRRVYIIFLQLQASRSNIPGQPSRRDTESS